MTYKKKLIEVAIPLLEISDAGAREQSIKRGKPTQIHKWWAGRPLVACRAVLWASLVDDPSSDVGRFPSEESQRGERERLFAILRELVAEVNPDKSILDQAKREIDRSCPNGVPLVLDPFGGGGAIPLESVRLGLPTASGDLNPVAVLLQRAMLEVPVPFIGRGAVGNAESSLAIGGNGYSGIAADVEHYGRVLQEEARAALSSAYPFPSVVDSSGEPVAWIWARTIKSPDPSWPAHVPLVRSWYLAKPGKKRAWPNGVWAEPVIDRTSSELRFVIRNDGTPPDGTISKSGGTCIATGTPITLEYVRAEARAGRLGQQLIAIVVDAGNGREFIAGAPADASAAVVDAPPWVPVGRLPDGGLGLRVQNYGFDEWWKLFTPRQLRALVVMSDLLPSIWGQVRKDCSAAGWIEDDRRLRDGGAGPTAYADAIITYLAMAIDRVADWNNAFCGWDSTNLVNQQLFRRQAVSMIWDYCEILPFGNGAGSLGATLKTIRTAIEALPIPKDGTVEVANRDARARVRELRPCMVSTDPPYYDNIGYADLSDFFYVWLRRNLADIWPDECSTILTPKSEELIADPSRHGGRAGANLHFESGMVEFMRSICDSQVAEVPATIFYAFKATETSEGMVTSTGWSTFLQAIVDAGLVVTSTWPMRTENKSRMRAMNSNALATSVVLACRKRDIGAPMATRGEFMAGLRSELPSAIRILQEQSISPVDLAQAAVGPGISVFSRYSKVVEADGSAMPVRHALALINEALAEVLSGEEAEFDPDTRFALTWFEQFGHNPGAYGDADVLARAKNTSVDGVQQAGVVVSRDGKVRLVERSELDADWDPTTDTRLTVWETTQYLIRALDSSESEAADLLRRMGGGMGDRARQLAYLLYGICDRKKWADEAGPYNMLVTAWPEIERLANAAPLDELVLDEDRLF